MDYGMNMWIKKTMACTIQIHVGDQSANLAHSSFNCENGPQVTCGNPAEYWTIQENEREVASRSKARNRSGYRSAPTSTEVKQLPVEEENGNPQTAVVAATTPVVELLWPSDPLRKILWRDH